MTKAISKELTISAALILIFLMLCYLSVRHIEFNSLTTWDKISFGTMIFTAWCIGHYMRDMFKNIYKATRRKVNEVD